MYTDGKCQVTSVLDPWHFGTDPDAVPLMRIREAKKTYGSGCGSRTLQVIMCQQQQERLVEGFFSRLFPACGLHYIIRERQIAKQVGLSKARHIL
jgi:hypothetical protein